MFLVERINVVLMVVVAVVDIAAILVFFHERDLVCLTCNNSKRISGNIIYLKSLQKYLQKLMCFGAQMK